MSNIAKGMTGEVADAARSASEGGYGNEGVINAAAVHVAKGHSVGEEPCVGDGSMGSTKAPSEGLDIRASLPERQPRDTRHAPTHRMLLTPLKVADKK